MLCTMSYITLTKVASGHFFFFFASHPSSSLLLGVNLQTRSEQESLSGYTCPLNKYLSEAPVQSCFPTVVYGTSWIRQRMGYDRE